MIFNYNVILLDTTYVLSFSLLMLHTDAFNKSVKRKMTKEEFVKNSRIDGVPPEILEVNFINLLLFFIHPNKNNLTEFYFRFFMIISPLCDLSMLMMIRM